MSRIATHTLASATVAAAVLLTLGCNPEQHVTQHKPVEPPVSKADAIPDAPVSGSIRGVAFQMKDARYVVDHRMDMTRIDIKLSTGAAESACAPVKPTDAMMVWLRLEKSDKLESQELHLDPTKPGPWSIHYQMKTPGGWVGSDEGYATVALRAAGADGKLSGGVSVCFADDQKSCVSGSFDALPCPWGIDAPVRGALPSEAIPEKFQKKWKEGGSAPSGSSSLGGPSPSALVSAWPLPSTSASLAPSVSALPMPSASGSAKKP